MNNLLHKSGNYFDIYFNAKNVRRVELLILRFAVLAFLIHLFIIFLGNNFLYFENGSSSTDINEVLESIKIYPNPTTNYITIDGYESYDDLLSPEWNSNTKFPADLSKIN